MFSKEFTSETIEKLDEDILDFIIQSDNDTETLYENMKSEATDGASKTISNIPSELELPEKLVTRETIVDYRKVYTKGLLREKKSKHDRAKHHGKSIPML